MSSCAEDWRNLARDPWILEVVEGYQLELDSHPNELVPVLSEPMNRTQQKLVEEEVQALQ